MSEFSRSAQLLFTKKSRDGSAAAQPKPKQDVCRNTYLQSVEICRRNTIRNRVNSQAVFSKIFPACRSRTLRSQLPRIAAASYVDWQKSSKASLGEAEVRTSSYMTMNSPSCVSYRAAAGRTGQSRNPGGSGVA